MMFIFGIILIFIQLSSSEAGGSCVIKFVRYSNPDYKDYAGQCCETTMSSGCGANECDPFIDICIGDVPKTRDCSHGKTRTGVFDNTDIISFQDKIGTLNNPVKFRFDKWLNGLSFTITVMDKDSFFSDDLIDDFMYQLTDIIPTPNGTGTFLPHRVRGRQVIMDIEYSVTCDMNYYGDCSNYCKPNSRHYCDSVQGRKICYQGWSGSDCDINVDDCQINPCLHGGQCLDGINNYTCNCTQEYTGQNCEFKKYTSISMNETRHNDTVRYNGSTTDNSVITTTESSTSTEQEPSTTRMYTDKYEITTNLGTEEEPDVSTTGQSSTEELYQTTSSKNSDKPNTGTTLPGGSSTGNIFVKETEYGAYTFGGKTLGSTSFHEDLSTTGYYSTSELTETHTSQNKDSFSSSFVSDPSETNSPPSTTDEVLTMTEEGKTSFMSSMINIISQEPTSTNEIPDKITPQYQTTDYNVFSLYSSQSYFTDDKRQPNVDTTTSPSITSSATQMNNSTSETVWESTTSGYNNKETLSGTNTINSNKGNTLSHTKPHTTEQTHSEGPFVNKTTRRQTVDTKTSNVPKNPESTDPWFSSFTNYYTEKETLTNNKNELPSRTGEISSTIDIIASIPVSDTTVGTTSAQAKCTYVIARNKNDIELRVFNLKQKQKEDTIKKMAIDILRTQNVNLRNEDIKISIYSNQSVIILFSNLAFAIDGSIFSKLGDTLCGTKTANVGKLQTISGDSSGSIVGVVVGLLYFGTLFIIAFILVRRKYRERNKVEDSCSDLETVVVNKNISEDSDKTRNNTKQSLLTTRAIDIETTTSVDKEDDQTISAA